MNRKKIAAAGAAVTPAAIAAVRNRTQLNVAAKTMTAAVQRNLAVKLNRKKIADAAVDVTVIIK